MGRAACFNTISEATRRNKDELLSGWIQREVLIFHCSMAGFAVP
jgi:hypothetical protein